MTVDAGPLSTVIAAFSRFWRGIPQGLWRRKKYGRAHSKRRFSGSDGKIGQGDSPPQLVIGSRPEQTSAANALGDDEVIHRCEAFE